MAANNQGIVHYAPQGRVYCGRQDAHIAVREADRFDKEPRQCKKCASKLAEARERTAKAVWNPRGGITGGL
jgi:hypothetical protein